MNKFKVFNIKSFKESEEIEIKPLTFFVGRNSCGKSSLIRFPVLLSQTFSGDVTTPLLLFGNLIDYGNYDDMIYKHSGNKFGFSLEFGPEIIRGIRERRIYLDLRAIMYANKKIDPYIREIMENLNNVRINIQITKPDKKMVVKKVELELNGQVFLRVEWGGKTYQLFLNNLFDKKAHIKDTTIEVDYQMVAFDRFIPEFRINEIVKKYVKNEKSLSEQEIEQIENYIDTLRTNYLRDSDIERDFTDWMEVWVLLALSRNIFSAITTKLNAYANQLVYVGPFRANPKRTYRDSESVYDDVGVHGENVSLLLRQMSQQDEELLNSVSMWFQKAMGYMVDVDDIGNSLFSIVVRQKLEQGEEIDNIIDVGYGISQVLPIVVQLLKRDEANGELYIRGGVQKKNFIIEQPELHLHPAAQAELAELLVESVNISRSRRILVETHSEHLLRKLQVLIADPDVAINSDQVAVYYVDKDDDGNSHVKKMKIDKNGQFLEPWPSGFFDKSYELVSELLFANSKIQE